MKHVTFTRDMRAQGFNAGERRLLPDELAAKLEAEGAIEPNPPTWPAQSAGQKPAPPQDPLRKLSHRERRELRRQQCQTK